MQTKRAIETYVRCVGIIAIVTGFPVWAMFMVLWMIGLAGPAAPHVARSEVVTFWLIGPALSIGMAALIIATGAPAWLYRISPLTKTQVDWIRFIVLHVVALAFLYLLAHSL